MPKQSECWNNAVTKYTKSNPDDHWGKPVLEIEAYKNGREYDIILSYPDLKIIRETIDY